MNWQCFQCSLSSHAILLEVCTAYAHEIVHLSGLSTFFIFMMVVNDSAKRADNLILVILAVVVSVDALIEHLKLFFVFFMSSISRSIGSRVLLVAIGCRQ